MKRLKLSCFALGEKKICFLGMYGDFCADVELEKQREGRERERHQDPSLVYVYGKKAGDDFVISHFVCTSVPLLIEAAAPKVVGDDDVRDGVEDELDVLGVGGARHVAVDLLGRGLVLGLELRLDVSRRLAVLLRACKKCGASASICGPLNLPAV